MEILLNHIWSLETRTLIVRIPINAGPGFNLDWSSKIGRLTAFILNAILGESCALSELLNPYLEFELEDNCMFLLSTLPNCFQVLNIKTVNPFENCKMLCMQYIYNDKGNKILSMRKNKIIKIMFIFMCIYGREPTALKSKAESWIEGSGNGTQCHLGTWGLRREMTQSGCASAHLIFTVFRIIECATSCIRKSIRFDDLANLQKEECLKRRHLKVNLAISCILKMESSKSTFVISSLYLCGVSFSK